MDKMQTVLLQKFDIRRLKTLCNWPECEERPTTEASIFEYSYKKGKKSFAVIYVCKEHVFMVRNIVNRIKEIEPAKVIGVDFQKIK